MKKVTVTGKSVEDAVKNGLLQLQATEEQVTFKVIEQPSKGLFGLIGVRDAKVELTLIEQDSAGRAEPAAKAESAHISTALPMASVIPSNDAIGVDGAEQFLKDVFAAMGLSVSIVIEETEEGLLFNLQGEELGILIGRRGQTLDALQYLVNIVANRQQDEHLRIILDAESFRERRRKTLEELAERLASRVIKSRREVVLEPMSPQERKIIHSNLQNHPKVKTYSKGEEPNRRIVITLK